MSLRDLFGGENVLRVGPEAVELWSGAPGLQLAARAPLVERGSFYDAEGLADALRTVIKEAARAHGSVILESAFAPALLVDTGAALSNHRQLDTLFRHRFALTYGGPGVSVAEWKFRTDYRFGEHFALVFAIAPAVEAALIEAARTADFHFDRWLPSLAWGFARYRAKVPRAHRSGWWAWPEQDRMLIAHITAGRVDGLNPAAPIREASTTVERLVAMEAGRLGVVAVAEPITLGEWSSKSNVLSPDGRVHRFAIGSETPCGPVAPGNARNGLKATAS